MWLTARCCGLSPACGNLAAPCVSGPIRVNVALRLRLRQDFPCATDRAWAGAADGPERHTDPAGRRPGGHGLRRLAGRPAAQSVQGAANDALAVHHAGRRGPGPALADSSGDPVRRRTRALDSLSRPPSGTRSEPDHCLRDPKRRRTTWPTP